MTSTKDGVVTLVTTTALYDGNGGEALKETVNKTLKDTFGITTVIDLTPLDATAPGYKLSNVHVDLQVRTLPGRKVIVASVPAGDPQSGILDGNADRLRRAGFTVIRIDNAPRSAVDSPFKTYTNALFLNDTVVVPKYGDAAKDAAAKTAYSLALGDKYKVVQVDASEAITFCGAVRCAARDIPRLPSRPEAKSAESKSPFISFDSATGILSITDDVVNFLGDPGAPLTDPRFVDDILLGATIEVGDFTLASGMSVPDRFAFVGGTLRFHKDGVDLLRASLPVLSIYGTQPSAALNTFAVLHDLSLAPPGTSPWLDAFTAEVLERPQLLPDFFLRSPMDLIALSNGFTESFGAVQLTAVGVTGNGVVPEPPLIAMAVCAIILRASWLRTCAVRVGRRRTAADDPSGHARRDGSDHAQGRHSRPLEPARAN